jgi:hypothetical protein
METVAPSIPLLNIESTLVYPIDGIKIDVNRLQQDLRTMEESFWIPQDRYARQPITHWHGVALYSVNGDSEDLRCADRLPVHRTPAGEKCSYICNELLPQFGAPWLRVVFYRLKGGTKIGRHRDLSENRMIPGVVRIHIPVITNDRIVMYVDDKPYRFDPGTAWYFDATAFHSVENNSDQDRIHLVADFKLSAELNRVLKPLTLNDRLRLALIFLLHVRGLFKAFFRFVTTVEGRNRIRVRARRVLLRKTEKLRGQVNGEL